MEDKYVYWDDESTDDHHYFIIPSKDYSRALGDVQVWYVYDPEMYLYPYILYIKYTDYANSELNDSIISGDI